MAWTPQDSENLYNLPNWASEYFRINEAGNVAVRLENKDREATELDVYRLTQEILQRGLRAPLLLRFNGILRGRVERLATAFNAARNEFNYGASYRSIYPIKVNQQRHVVEELLAGGREFGLGLEVGSKPELLAAMGLKHGPDALVICNGYKDRDYIEMALLYSRLGVTPLIVVEKFSELQTILVASQELEIKPHIGVRMKPRVAGSGRWKDSGGDRSKFGLTARQIVDVIERLKQWDMLDCLELLHFHIGSQITDVRSVKAALREATRTLTGLRELGAPIGYFDVGGGLAVDYDGSNTTGDSSKNYTLQEYANDVVWHVGEACREANIPQPVILSESGRSLTAHHALLVTEVLGVTEFASSEPLAVEPGEHETVRKIGEIHAELMALHGEELELNYGEAFHDSVQLRDEAMLFFSTGHIGLPERARVEEFHWATCKRVLGIVRGLEHMPAELASLERDMADTYFLNFSLFQSLPDSWAINQLFPVLPLHRHNEEPTRRATLVDVTCDSDGKVNRFVGRHGVKDVLEVHEQNEGERYFMGFFLVGAYQEILGDMHNLFGDTNVLHVDVDSDGKPKLQNVVRGDRVQELLSYVEYHENDLLAHLHHSIEGAIAAGTLTYEQSALLQERYERGLTGYSYLTQAATPANHPTLPTSK
jgi:arginine decarboxylase